MITKRRSRLSGIPLAGVSYLISAFAGASALPATYWSTRSGSIVVSILILSSLAAVAGVLSQHLSKHTDSRAVLGHIAAFVCGAVIAEAIAFGVYYLHTGRDDPKLAAGVAVSILELAVIAVVGSAVLFIAWLVARRLTSR